MTPMSLVARVNSIWRVPVILLATAVLASASVAFSVIDGTGRLQHRCARAWSLFILWVSRVRVEVRGLENLEPGRGYIFVSNHLSMFDHWAFLAMLPFQFRFVSKASLFRIPFLGWHLKRAGNIPVDRRSPRRTVRSYQAVADRVREGLSFVVYPEGMRTWGRPAAFKRGAFLLAVHARAPIVPVTIIDAHERLSRGSAVIHPGRMKMVLHPPLAYEDYRHLDLESLARKVREIVLQAYPEEHSTHGSKRPERRIQQ